MNWWTRLLRREEQEALLEKELRFHMEQRVADLMRSGLDAEEAERRVRQEFGGADQVKEACRDARGTRWLEDLWQDARYTLRTLRQKPGFTAITVSTLALGIGAATLMFTLVDGVLLKPLPFPQPARLAFIAGRLEGSHFADQFLSYPDFLDCHNLARSFDLAGVLFNSGTLSEPGEAEYEDQFEITANLFTVLGVPVYRGRAFLPDEDKPGGTPAAILGYALWQRRFGSSESALGSTLVLDGKRYTIVGVAPPHLDLDGEADLFTPLGQDPAGYLKSRGPHPVKGFARLSSGATIEQANAEVSLIGKALEEQYKTTNKGRTLYAKPLRPDVDEVRPTLWLLLGAVGLVLLIACANVASLMLARAVSRERELALRIALGAGRFRLIRQRLTESAILGLAGGALGIALAAAGIGRFLAFWPGDLPRSSDVRLDWRVLAFTVAVSLLCSLLFGVAPAMRVRASAIDRTLREGARTVSTGSAYLHGGFVILEIAIAVVLLVSAGTLGRTMMRLSALDPGVNIHNVLTMRMAISPALLSNPDRIRAAWAETLDRGRRVAGVESVATVDTVPMRPGHNEAGYWTNASVPPDGQQPIAITTCVSPGYFNVMGIPLHSGRLFDDRDVLSSRHVIVIDDVLERSAFHGEPAVGRELWVPDMGPAPLLIVGVVGHVRYWGLAGDDQSNMRAQFYYPFAQVPDVLLRRWSQLMSIAVRSSVPPLSLVRPLRHELRGEANDQVLYEVRTFEQLASGSLARQRFLLFLFGVFAAFSLLLACMGIYGVLAYLVGMRIPEIGVRMALGATRLDVLGMIFRQSLTMIFAGVVAGGLGALVAIRLLLRWVEGMQPMGVPTFAAMIALLVAAALVATFLPARRASRTDPMRALRQE